MRAVLVTIWIAASLSAQTSTYPTEDHAPAFGMPHGRLRFLWQNDSWFGNSDRFFTNGIELGYTLPDGAWSTAIADSLTWLPFRGAPSATASEIALGQDMFTPEDYRAPQPSPDDRPYAGWLHANLRHEALTLGGHDRRDRLDLWELELGVVGPSSLADNTQIEVHHIVGAPRPQGWGYQLHDEPGLVLGYGRKFRSFYDDATYAPFATDFIGNYGVRLGNVETSARLGATVRFGLDLPRHLGSAMRPLDDTATPYRVHFQAGVEGRLVLRDIFLDGNTFRSSAQVDRNYLVGDFHFGVKWEPRQRVRISLLEVFRTPEFDSPSTHGDVAHFTSFQLEAFF